MKNKVMRGYKALNKDMSSTYGDMKYETGKQYRLDGKLILCKNGYHFCKNMIDVSKFYNLNNSRVFEIEASGNILNGEDKSCTDNIRLIRELSEEEISTVVSKNHYNKTVAENGNTDVKVLKRLSNDENWRIRYAVAENQNADRKILEKLSLDTNSNVRCAVAENCNTSIEILENLSNDGHFSIRCAVIGNPNITAKILETLSDDEDFEVRYAVAINQNTSIKILMKLTKDKAWYVKLGIAKNPNVTTEILKKLSADEDDDVRYAANENLNKKSKIR